MASFTGVSKKIHLIFLLYFMVLMGIISLRLGKDVNWDLRNYHYYIGYAFLNLKSIQDFFVAGVVSYLNPFTDVVNYLMIKHLPPKLTGFLLGAVQGLNLYFLWVMTLMLTSSVNSFFYRAIVLLAIPILGLLCANVIGEIGTTFNDLTLANWVLLSLMIIGFSLQQDLAVRKKLIFMLLAGGSLGIAIGLKLTMALYFIGALVALMTLKGRGDGSKLKVLLLFSLGSVLGFVLSNGYWMAVLWKFFHNPIFPYYNHFFKSPYYYPKNIIDVRYFPHNLLQTLFYPFYFSWQPCLTSDAYFRDFRIPAVYALLIIYCGKILIARKQYPEYAYSVEREYTQFLIIFFVISYIIWQYQFSIQRYLMVLDIISPLLIYLLVTNIFNQQSISYYLVLLIFVFLVITLQPQRWEKTPWTQDYFTVNIPPAVDLQRKSVVINVDFGISFLRAFFPENWHFMSAGLPAFPSNACSPHVDNSNIPFPFPNPIINPWLQNREYNYYVLFSDTPKSVIADTLKRYQLRLGEQCSIIQVAGIKNYFICPVSS